MGLVITGANGFVGRALIERIINGRALAGEREELPALAKGLVGVVRDKHGAQELRRQLPGLHVVAAENEEALAAVLDDRTTVLHAAWSSVPATAASDVAFDASANLSTGLSLLELCGRSRVQRFIFLSSGGTVYGPRCSAPHTESTPVDPVGAYGASKDLFERYLRLRAAHHGFEALILRPGNLYGRVGNVKRQQGVVEHWLRAAANGEQVVSWNGLEVVRDYVFIDDMVDVLVASVLDRTLQGTFNVGTGQGRSLGDLVGAIERATGKRMRLEVQDQKQAAVQQNVLDPSKIGSVLDRRNWTRLEDGVAATWRSIK